MLHACPPSGVAHRPSKVFFGLIRGYARLPSSSNDVLGMCWTGFYRFVLSHAGDFCVFGTFLAQSGTPSGGQDCHFQARKLSAIHHRHPGTYDSFHVQSKC